MQSASLYIDIACTLHQTNKKKIKYLHNKKKHFIFELIEKCKKNKPIKATRLVDFLGLNRDLLMYKGNK